MPFVPGYNKSITMGSVTLGITETDLDTNVDVLETTHTLTQGQQTVLPGIFRGEGRVTANVDSAALPTGFGIFPGNKGMMFFRPGNGNPIAVPVMVRRLLWRSAVATLVSYSFEVVYDASAGSYQNPS